MVICMALMDGRMFGWRLPEARKGTDGDTGDEAEDIRPLHCVVHPILRVRLPPTAAAAAADSTSMEAGAGSEAQPQEAAGPDASGTHPRRVPDLSASVRLPTFLSPVCAAAFTPLWHVLIDRGTCCTPTRHPRTTYLVAASRFHVFTQCVCSCMLPPRHSCGAAWHRCLGAAAIAQPSHVRSGYSGHQQ